MSKQQEWLHPLWTTLLDCLALLNEMGAPHLIIGGLAVSLLGEPRTTKDIDAVTALSIDDIERLLAQSRRHHFAPRLSDAAGFARQRKIVLLQHVETQIPVDLSFAQIPFEQEAFQRATTITIDQIPIPIPTPEDLIIMKAVAHRPQDLGDIDTLAELYHSTLDVRRIRYWVKEFAQALEMPELYKDIDAILKQHTAPKRRRPKGSRRARKSR